VANTFIFTKAKAHQPKGYHNYVNA